MIPPFSSAQLRLQLEKWVQFWAPEEKRGLEWVQEYGEGLELLDYEEKQEVEREIPREHEENLYLVSDIYNVF